MTYEDYLIHSSECYHAVYGPQPRNRMTRKNPKYIAKEGNRYFYSQAEYDAFKRGGRRKASTNPYTQSVRQRTKSATVYGPSPRRSSERTPLAKKARQAYQRSRPKLVKMRDSFKSSFRELKRKASSTISRGKEFADLCFANIRGQMNRFNDKVVTPGMAKARSAAERIKASASKKIADIKAYAPEIVKAGSDIIRASLRIDDDLKNARTAEGEMNTSRLLSESTEYRARRKGPPTRQEQNRINEAKQRYKESVKTYEAARDRGEITQRELNDAKKRLRDNLNKLLGR